MTKTRRAVVLLGLVLASAGCGQVEVDEEPPGDDVPSTRAPATVARPATTVTTLSPPTTAPAPTTAGRTCLAILTDGLELARSHSLDQRGIAGADEAKYKARAQVLADEARREGCAVPGVVENFLR